MDKIIKNNKEELDKNGILIFQDLFPDNIISRIDNDLLKIIDDIDRSRTYDSDQYIVIDPSQSSQWGFLKCQSNPKPVIKVRGAAAYDQGMLDIFNAQKLLDLKDILSNSDLLSIISSINKKIKNVNCYCNHSVTTTRDYHRDSKGGKQFKAFIYLTDVLDESYGPYSYIKGTHLETTNEGETIHCIANKGSLIISNQSGIHRGIPQAEGRSRRLLSINL